MAGFLGENSDNMPELAWASCRLAKISWSFPEFRSDFEDFKLQSMSPEPRCASAPSDDLSSDLRVTRGRDRGLERGWGSNGNHGH